MNDLSIIDVTADNVEEHGFFCVKNKKHPGYKTKLAWLYKRFEEGLRIRLLVAGDGKPAGFIEYIPGKYTWRTVEAPDHLVIQCMWVASKKFPFKGMAGMLLENCQMDAVENGFNGVAVVSSDGPWMAGKQVFLKKGFEQVDEAPPSFQLMVKQLKPGPAPRFPGGWEHRFSQFTDLELLYTNQCPFIGKALNELPPVARKYGIKLKLSELSDAAEARRRMPTPYGVIALGYQGRLLADHPISATRFRNILQKDLGLSPDTQN